MLDSSYNAKLGDFGLARLGDHGTGPQTTDLVKGTMGYIDPEFVNTHRRSTESDICSYSPRSGSCRRSRYTCTAS